MKASQRTEAGLLTTGRVNKREAAVLNFAKQVQTVVWDFSVDGGAIGDILFGVKLPAGSIVTNVWVDKEVAVTGATAVTVSAGATALTAQFDLVAAATTASRALAGSATAIKLSAASELKLSIATAAGTAGKVAIYVEYVKKP